MIKKLKSSLTAKIFLLTLLLLTICCIATYGFISWMIPKTYPNQIDLDEAELLAYDTVQELKNVNLVDYHIWTEVFEDISNYRFNADLDLHIFDSDGYELNKDDLEIRTDKTIADYDTSKRTKEYSFSFADNSDKYILFYADNSQAINQTMEALNKILPYLIIMVMVISVFAALIYSKYITAPILKINKASKKMTELDFDVKCGTNSTDELGALSDNLNTLAGKLSTTLEELGNANAQLQADIDKERQLEKERMEFFSAVSHELKTPITIAKGQLQGMIYKIGRYKDKGTYLPQTLEVLNSLEKMVQELLTVYRMEAPGYTCNREPLNLGYLIKQCLNDQEDIFIQRDIKLTCNLPENVICKGDRLLLKKVFDNLIINALTYSSSGNTISVDLMKENKNLKFQIKNTGTHIENEDLSRVFEAFYRPDQSRSRQTGGSGLGLYIVKKILDLHSVQYGIENGLDSVIFTIIF